MTRREKWIALMIYLVLVSMFAVAMHLDVTRHTAGVSVHGRMR